MRNVPPKGRNGGLRSAEWFERRDLDGFLHRSWLKSTGVTDEAFRGPGSARGNEIRSRIAADGV